MSERQAEEEVGRLRGLLARLEWVYRDWEGRPSCPACGVHQGEPHARDCWLAPEIPPPRATP